MNRRKKTGFLVGLCLLGVGIGDLRSEPASALSSIEAFAAREGDDGAPPILGVVGFFADPQPPQWLVLTPLEGEEDVYRESVVKDGVVTAERMFRKVPGQDLPSIPIDLSEVKYDSDDAFAAAEEAAASHRIRFESVHFQLRCRDEGEEPVWMVNILSPYHISIGVVFVSAKTGEVVRETWKSPSSGRMYSSTIELSKPQSGR